MNNTSTPRTSLYLPAWYLTTFFAIIAASAPWGNEYLVNFIFVKTYMAGMISALLFLFWSWKTRESLQLKLYLNPASLWLGALFLLGLLSAFWSNDASVTLSDWMIWLTLFFSFYLASNIQLNYDNYIKFSLGLTVAAAIISIIGILQHLFDFSVLFQVAAPSSTFGNKNMAAQIMVLLFPLPFFLLASKQIQNKMVWWVSFSVAIISIYLFYTTTRAAWLGVIAQIILISIYLFYHKNKLNSFIDWNKNKQYSIIISLVFILIMINFTNQGVVPFWVTASGNLGSIVDSASSSSSARYEIWGVAINMIKDSPFFGSGLGTFYHNESNLGYATWRIRSTFHVHNDILELGVELGLAGWFLFLGFVTTLLFAIKRVLKNVNEIERWFYYLLFTALVGTFINMQFSFPYQLPIAPVLFGFYIAFIIKADNQFSRKDKVKIIQLKIWQKGSILLLSTLLVITSIIIQIGWINEYKMIDSIAKQVAQKKYQGFSLNAPLNYDGIQNSLHYASRFFYNKKEYEATRLLDLQILNYWPNDFKTMSRLVYILIVLKRFDEALDYIEPLKKLVPPGLLFPQFSKIDIALIKGDKKSALNDFNNLLKEPDRILAINEANFIQLISKAIRLQSHDNIEKIYSRYQNNFSVSCKTEIELSIFYKKNKQNKLALKHINSLIDKKASCDKSSKEWLIKKGIKI